MVTFDYWKLLSRYRDSRKCKDCGKDKGSETEPCYHCDPPVVRRSKVGLRYAPVTRIGARYKSSTQPGVSYAVRVDRNKVFVSCECPGFHFRGECKHKTRWEEIHGR